MDLLHKLSQWKRAVFPGSACTPIDNAASRNADCTTASSGPPRARPDGIELLSVELLLLISHELSEDDKLAFRQTCRRVCIAVGSGISSLPITSVVAQHVLHSSHGARTYGQRLGARFPLLSHLHCTVTGNVIRAFFQSCNGALLSVSSIDISCKSGLTEFDLTLAAAACPGLRDLAIDAFAFSDPMQVVCSLSQLTRLNLRLMRRSSLLVWDDALLTQLHSLHNLQELVLHADSLLGSAGIEAITKLRSLHSLHLHQVHSLAGTDIKLLSRMRTLRTLVLNDCSVKSASYVPDLCSLPRLRSLSLQLHEAPLPSSPSRPITYSSDFLAELSALPELSALTLQGYLSIHTPSPSFRLPDLASLTLQGPSTPSAPSPSPATSTASHSPRSPPIPPDPGYPISQLPSALSCLALCKALRTLSVTDWYYLSCDILSILPRFLSLETVKVACLPGLAFSDLEQLHPMHHLTSLTLHTASSSLGPSACADVQRMLGHRAVLSIVEEPIGPLTCSAGAS